MGAIIFEGIFMVSGQFSGGTFSSGAIVGGQFSSGRIVREKLCGVGGGVG